VTLAAALLAVLLALAAGGAVSIPWFVLRRERLLLRRREILRRNPHLHGMARFMDSMKKMVVSMRKSQEAMNEMFGEFDRTRKWWSSLRIGRRR
jgi:hypothetical protein